VVDLLGHRALRCCCLEVVDTHQGVELIVIFFAQIEVVRDVVHGVISTHRVLHSLTLPDGGTRLVSVLLQGDFHVVCITVDVWLWARVITKL